MKQATAIESSNRTSNSDSVDILRYEILDKVNNPDDLRYLSDYELEVLAEELRREVIRIVSKTGGHLGASLGVVELSVAIHAVFNTPQDKLIWDVGHQSYPHKILTGRRDKMPSLRQGGGISGFTKRSESEYDPFGAGHSSTSISAALGMATARDLATKDNDVICVIGDGSIGAGMAYEAMNHAGEQGNRLIVILNDNDMSIAPAVGAMSKYLTKLVSDSYYINARNRAKAITEYFPSSIRNVAKKAEAEARASFGNGTFFEDMGFYYIGPVDGHDMKQLLTVLRNVKQSSKNAPILIHCSTVKGKGYLPAENSSDKMHGVGKFDLISGKQHKNISVVNEAPQYTKVFAQALVNCAKHDDKILGITAAMPAGTGMDVFAKEFPSRMFDVGIAEQHAVTFAAGLACEGFKPFVAIYSTFLQRAYDQIIHDVALQKLPVRFAIDRAGYVGADGQTHAGSFDIAMLGCIPDMVLMAAGDEADLVRMVNTAANFDDSPIAFRYPRGCGISVDLPKDFETLEIGKGRIIHEGEKIAILNYGDRLGECIKACDILKQKGINPTLADARFAKPLDTDLILKLAKTHKKIVTVESGSIGGFGSYVLELLNSKSLIGNKLQIKTMHLPDIFQAQDSSEEQYRQAKLDAKNISENALCGHSS